ncbi:MAG: type I-B CRISPR-associated protein Cas7/Csh2 [Spirochaetia bacterium]|nr:type I-B CRISPR-associated protein Cas7/Csh2 [Spirochaetota bacterium]MDW8113252.1 type I-B CRISPR-associated protein Cas7/Csh2 [Spirochaetia bacterium]
MINNRREFLFIYDVSFANPNGDPANENRPRIDEETGINYVTPDRLKRVIRDQLVDFGENIFVKKEVKDGKVLTRKDIFDSYGKNIEEILKECIDIRLFGITLAVGNKDDEDSSGSEKGKSKVSSEGDFRSLTGPVQFKFGKSLHRVSLEYVKGTTVLASKKGRVQGTMTEKWILPYSLIVFYGIANEKASQSTGLKDGDIDKMLRAMWIGFKANTDIISTSKMGHNPRLLLEIVYKENTLTHIGDLDNLVSLKTNKRDEEVRSIEEVEIDMSKLADKVKEYKDKIQKVRYAIDSSVKLSSRIEDVFSGVSVERINFDK